MVVEMLEELLGAGFPVKTAVQMMNTALVIGREEVSSAQWMSLYLTCTRAPVNL